MRIQEIFSQFVYVQPKDPEKIMIDFYFMVGYVYGTEFKDDVVDWVMKEAVKDCVEAHRKHMVKALKYCCAAEFKHIDKYCLTLKKASSANNLGAALNILKEHYSPLTYRFLVEYLSIKPLYFSSSGSSIDNDNPRLGLDKRNSKYPVNPDSGKYLNQFKALVKTQRLLKYSNEDIAKVMIEMFDSKEGWKSAYGGIAWKNISECLLKLLQAKTLDDKVVYCDHAYDLEHNTGVVFNKMESYAGYDDYRWIKKDLDWKRDNRSLKDFYDKVSTQLQKVVAYVSKYKYDDPLLPPERTSKEIEKIKQEVQGTIQQGWFSVSSVDQIHVGDTVKLVKDSTDTLHKKGEEGKVIKVGGATLTHEYSIKIEYSNGSKFWEPYYNVVVKKEEQQTTKNNTPIGPKVPVTLSNATLATDLDNLKVGDEVQIKKNLSTIIQSVSSNMTGYKGEIATITEVLPNLQDEPTYKINLDSGEWYWTKKMFEDPSNPTKSASTASTDSWKLFDDIYQLKVGDKVKVIVKPTSGSKAHIGDVGVITSINKDSNDNIVDYKVEYGNGDEWYEYEDEIELVSKDTDTQELKVGDEVQINPDLHVDSKLFIVNDMVAFAGTITKIDHLYSATQNSKAEYFFLDLPPPGDKYFWTTDMFTPIKKVDTKSKDFTYGSVGIGDKLYFTYSSGNIITGTVMSKDLSLLVVKWSDASTPISYTPEEFNSLIKDSKLELETGKPKEDNDGWINLTSVSQLSGGEKIKKEGYTGEVIGTDSVNSYTVEWEYNPGIATPYYQDDIDGENWKYIPNTEDSDNKYAELVRKQIYTIDEFEVGKKVIFTNIQGMEYPGTITKNTGLSVCINYDNGGDSLYDAESIKSLLEKGRRKFELLVPEEEFSIEKKNGNSNPKEYKLGKWVQVRQIDMLYPGLDITAGVDIVGTISEINTTAVEPYLVVDNQKYYFPEIKELISSGDMYMYVILGKDEEPVHSELEDFSDDGEIEHDEDVEEGDYGGPVQWTPVNIKEVVEGDLIRDANQKQYEVLKIYREGLSLQKENENESYIDFDHLFKMGPWEKVAGH
jgi:hypothetical protein